jgi:hypothetical protein
MNARTLKLIAALVVVMGAVLLFMNSTDRSRTENGGDLLLPELKGHINEINRISVSGTDDAGSISILNDGSQWVVLEKGNFPADVGKVREILLELADARAIEQKTSNPERYEQLGVHDAGTTLLVEGDGFSYGVIVGNSAQSNYRYARLTDQEQSWLIDKNPDLPSNAGGWLRSDIIDIDASRVRSVSISQTSGEQIHLSKAAAEDTNYAVDNIPEGRELSYPTVANGIGGALNDLELDDVQQGTPADEAVITVVETFDGLTITVQSESTDEATWIALSADADGEASEEAAAINAVVSGWMYKVPDYKANLLVRNWDDILKAEETEDAE